ncbi:helix-turn-helix transcriptional regulator [uncultured Adlercreutzia sp.]|uniref:helix-turn-helix transcriptional regulator n=1 Tax=uncultured Adlercreutzia sp. TaxID=875803 RepID=UPI0026F3CA08|nr:helix-turn-helix transcriptional regulator [uncultured Adlercreutzia sp.]
MGQRHDAPQGAISKLESALKARYLGIGFIWAWVYCSYETFAVYPNRAGIAIHADATWIVSAATVVVALWVGGLVLARRPDIPERPLAIAAAASLAAGTLISVAPDLFGSGASAVVVASGLLTGTGSGLLTLLWGQELARLDIECSELAVPAASLVMIACTLVIPYLPTALGTLATASLPVASVAMLLLTYRDAPQPEASRPCAATEGEASSAFSKVGKIADAPLRASSPDETVAPRSAGGSRATGESHASFTASMARIAVLLFLTYSVLGCGEALQANADAPFRVLGIDWPTLIGSACGVAVMVGFLFYAARPTFDSLFRLTAPLMVFALALLPWADLWAIFAGTTFTAATNTVLNIGALLFVAAAARKGQVNAALGVGITQGSLQLGVLAGNFAGERLGPAAAASSTGLFAVALGLIALFALCWLFYPTDRARPRAVAQIKAPAPAGHPAEKAEASAVPAESAVEPAREGSIDERCLALAEACGLSTRETEILGYLARGRSQPYIREELVLSKNTVATHVKHLYQKLNVHSRQELLDLFEAR